MLESMVLVLGQCCNGSEERRDIAMLTMEDGLVDWRGRITRTAVGEASMAGQLVTNVCGTWRLHSQLFIASSL